MKTTSPLAMSFLGLPLIHPRTRSRDRLPALALSYLALCAFPIAVVAAEVIPAPGTKLPPVAGDRVIAAEDVTVERVGTSIPIAGGRSLPLCSYPNYPCYKGGPPESAESYESTEP